MSRALHLLLAVLALGAPLSARAHEVRPAYFEIVQDSPHHYQATWKQPVVGDYALRLAPHLSGGWLDAPLSQQFSTPAFLIRTWSIDDARPGGPVGQTLRIDGLERTITDALVRVSLADGRVFETVLRPDQPQARIAFVEHPPPHALAYLRMGVEHILTGVDHLMFVTGLLLIVGVRWRLVKAITAFTAAHSLTLAASALGFVHAPSAVIEALVALSIVFVAAELVRGWQGVSTLTGQRPWLVAFVFGLLHGFAFAGALAEVGLPKDAIPLSLFLFNLGVEIGQLAFVGAAAALILLLRPVRRLVPAVLDQVAQRIPPYAIGSFAAFWVLERAAAAFASALPEMTR